MAIPRNRKRMNQKVEEAIDAAQKMGDQISDETSELNPTATQSAGLKATLERSIEADGRKKTSLDGEAEQAESTPLSDDYGKTIVSGGSDSSLEDRLVHDGERWLEHQAQAIIYKHIAMASGLSVVPLPLFNLASLYFIKIRMASQLADIHGVSFSEEKMRSILLSMVGSYGASVLSSSLNSFLYFVPIVGPTITRVSYPLSAAAVTYAVGQVLHFHFQIGGNLLDFNIKDVREFFYHEFRKGMAIGRGNHSGNHS